MKGKRKYYVIFIVKEGLSYSVLIKRRISVKTEKISFSKDKVFEVDIRKPTYMNKFKLFYFIDINEGLVSFNKVSESINPEVLDLVLKKSIIRQLTMSFGHGLGLDFMSLLLGIAGGFIGGYIIGGIV